MALEPTAPCPHCGTPTAGTHIAGTVYDYQCQPCVDAVDRGFERFLDQLYAEPDVTAQVIEEVEALRRNLDSSFPGWRRFDHRIADGLDRIELLAKAEDAGAPDALGSVEQTADDRGAT